MSPRGLIRRWRTLARDPCRPPRHPGRRRRANRRGPAAALVGLCLLPPGSAGASGIRLTDVTKSCGIDLVTTSGGTPSREILEVNGGGLALFDHDNDGDLDLFVANGATLAEPERGPGSRLYANRGDGSFEDVTARLGISLRRWAMGVAVGDVDADGCDDLYVACYGPDVLLRNECNRPEGPRFVDVSAAAGIGDRAWGTSAAFGDVDGDGDLDLYVANYLAFDVRNPPDRAGKTFKGVPVMAGPAGLQPEDDILYENLGGRFRDVTRESGIVERTPGYGLGVRIFDYDGDGRQDIYVGNDSTENFLFRNLGRRRFEEIGRRAGCAANYDGATQATMGIALGDVDGNGFADLFSTNFSSDTNTLHLNLGDGFFDDRTSQFGLGLVSRPFLQWGCGFYDFDGDADEDLFVASGHVYPETARHAMDSGYEQEPLLFERAGARFERVQDAGPLLSKKYLARATAFGDLDGDGDVDIVMAALNGPVHVFRNDSPQASALVVRLRGPAANPHAYGARLELASPAGIQRRWITGGGSYQSVDAPEAYFGLGPAAAGAKVRPTLRVVWPDGRQTEHGPLVPDRVVTLRHDRSAVEAAPLRGRPAPPPAPVRPPPPPAPPH